MLAGLPGGSPGPNHQVGCLGLAIAAIVSLAAAAALLALLWYATSFIEI